MAKAKKKKPAAKKKKPVAAAKGAKKRVAKKSAPIALSSDEKSRLLKPRDGWIDLLPGFVAAWQKHRRAVPVPGHSPAALNRLFKRALAASQREDKVQAAFDEKIRPLADARLVAAAEMWKATLEVWGIVRAVGDVDPSVTASFDAFASLFQGRPSGGTPTPTPAPA